MIMFSLFLEKKNIFSTSPGAQQDRGINIILGDDIIWVKKRNIQLFIKHSSKDSHSQDSQSSVTIHFHALTLCLALMTDMIRKIDESPKSLRERKRERETVQFGEGRQETELLNWSHCFYIIASPCFCSPTEFSSHWLLSHPTNWSDLRDISILR